MIDGGYRFECLGGISSIVLDSSPFDFDPWVGSTALIEYPVTSAGCSNDSCSTDNCHAGGICRSKRNMEYNPVHGDRK